MKIAVCIKQVPGTSQVEIDPKTGTLKRDGVASKMNPYDLYALETALRLKEQTGAEVTALTMGPPQAEAVLREAYMMGVDHAVLLSDRRFGGADVLATSRTISQGLLATGPYDLILCGKQTTDGDTAQVGAELAEYLELPHTTGVCKIGQITSENIQVDIELPMRFESLRIQLPCLLMVDKGIFEPRLPSYRRKVLTEKWPVQVLTLDDLKDKDASHYGLNGSPTQVKRIFPPERNTESQKWNGNGVEVAEKLYRYLDEHKFLQIPG